MLEEEKEREKELKAKIATALDILNLDKLEKELEQLTAQQNEPEVFNDFNKLKEVNQKVSKVEKTISPWKDLQSSFEEVEMLIEIAVEEKDISQREDIVKQLTRLEKEFAKLEVLLLFQDKFDEANAYLTIHSGAGGTESCDWASMLLRMYERWSEQKDFQYSIVGYQAGEEAGLKSVCLLVKGMYAYGLLKGESGVHRLVRISPFDSNKKRHTSFASVMVTAEIDDDIEIDINPADLRIDTYRASGAGGQHVNTTDSAVRITHQPTGIVVTCQAERSQHQNKEAAFKILRARLYEDIRRKQEAEMESKNADKKKIEWGSQIRSYVFHPYRMVKDHRMDYQTSDVLGVMDGAIDDFLNNFLKHSKK